MTSGFYLLGGIGSVNFAGDQKFTVNFGAGYRVLPTDWLAIHIAVQDRVFDSDLLGETKLTNNLEAPSARPSSSRGVAAIMKRRIFAAIAARAGARCVSALPALAAAPAGPRRTSSSTRDSGKPVTVPVQGPGRDDQFLGHLVRPVPPGNAAARSIYKKYKQPWASRCSA